MPDFVNPYNFVPLPNVVRRGIPSGHDRAVDGLLLGHIDFDLTAKTELSLGSEAVLRGSNLHGAIRSLHEAMCGSCLRVFDGDFVPVYRELPLPRQDRKLGFYENGRIRSAALDNNGEPWVVKIDHRCIDPPADAKTLGRVNFNVDDLVDSAHERFDPYQRIPHGRTVTATPNGGWVLLVNETRAKSRNPHPTFWFAAVPSAMDEDVHPISEAAWNKLKATVDGADDQRPQALTPDNSATINGHTYVKVFVPPPPAANGRHVGWRLKASAELIEGQPVWFELDDSDQVARISLSQVWRRQGEHPAKERVPEDVKPCDDWEKLCPSCAVFGAADTSKREEDEDAVQNSYRGHVVVLDPESEQFQAIERELPTGAQPRPGAGQFYLQDRSVTQADQLDTLSDATPAAREWGSRRDALQGGPRRLRGRKFYWTTSIRPPGTGERTDTFRLVPAGTTYAGRLVFENLSRVQLGAVLAALDPRLWLAALSGRPDDIDPAKARFRVGGGKPHGLGSAVVDIRTVQPNSTSRWLGGPDPDPIRAGDLVAEWVRAEEAVHKPEAWKALAHLVTEDVVSPYLVKYPPSVVERGVDNPFFFWTGSQGFKRERWNPQRRRNEVTEVNKLLTLKPAEEPDPVQREWP